ncbi:MAG: glycosyltransferase family 4 protein [Actinomycetota bacterium]
MKIAIVCPYAWDRFGGVQTHVRAQASTLRERGHEVTVIAPRTWLAPRPPGDLEQVDEAVRIGRAVSIPANGSLAPITFGPVAAAGIRRTLGELRPDVVHLHEPLIPSLSGLALLNASAPCVGTFHASSEASMAYWTARPFLKGAIDRLRVRIVVSEAARDLIARYFPGSYEQIPNGVEVSRYRASSPVDLGAGRTVLFLGRFERRKGLEVLIQAMARLRDLSAKLVVVGTGPERRACRALAERLEVEVQFIGAVHDDLKAGIFRSVDVYCAPALGGESFGIVLIEAMAAGAPVVCSDLPGFRAVAGDAALLVPPDDVGALAVALRAVLADVERARTMSAAGRAVANRFDWRLLGERLEDVYVRAASGAGR